MPPDTRNEILNAENEDALHAHSVSVHALSHAIRQRVVGNEVLRHAIDQARQRTQALADFELRIKQQKDWY